MIHSQDSSLRTEKLIEIIKAAQVRFGIWGLEKTSMREIAEDLNMSKGSLYYYFPDKEHLYKAVVEKEQSEFISMLNERIKEIQNPDLILNEYVKIRLEYFRSLINLSRLRLELYSEIGPVIADIMVQFRKSEKEIIMNILKEGKKKGIFNIEEIEDTALLFLDLLRGLRISFITKKKLLYIEEQEYESLMKKTISITNIFVRGLKYRQI